MRILITGGAGFIGAQIAAAYLQDGHEVAVLDNFSTGLRQNVPASAQLFTGDITCQWAVQNAFRRFAPEVISHHAAQSDVRHSLADPAFAVSVNVLGSLNVLRQATRDGVERFIFASSGGAIYGETRPLPARESMRAQPISPYGLTKARFEACLRAWQQMHGIVPVVLRYANVYGPCRRADGEGRV